MRDAESKQVEFVRAEGVPEKRLYVYDGGRFAQHIWAITKTIVPTRVESWGGLKARYREGRNEPADASPPRE